MRKYSLLILAIFVVALTGLGCSRHCQVCATAPDSIPPCTFTLDKATQSFPAVGGNGGFSVSTSAGCLWTPVSNVPWITITPGWSGTGNGSVQYTVAVNTGEARDGTITAGGQTLKVHQDAVAVPTPTPSPSPTPSPTPTPTPTPTPCTFTLDKATQSFPAVGGNGGFSVSTSAGCLWTPVSNVPWITITPGWSGTGNGSVQYTVAVNTGEARDGTITVGGQTFTVSQAAGTPTCTFTVVSSILRIGSLGGNGSVSVGTQAGCSWTATSNASWIILGNHSGTGNNVDVTFTIDANPGPERTGTITVSGASNPFTITQAAGAPACTITLTPTSKSYDSAGKFGETLTVSTSNNCSWSTSVDVFWIAVTGSQSGTGNGTVTYNVAGNAGAARTGKITVGNAIFTVTQSSPGGH